MENVFATKQKVEIDSFSGYKIYPSKGKLFVRGDSKVFRFSRSKTESLFHQRKNPRKIAWTQVYRRMHKKGVTEEAARKRKRATVKYQRGIVGAPIDLILQRRNMTGIERKHQRDAFITRVKGDRQTKKEKKSLAQPAHGPQAPKAQKQARPMKGTKGGRGGR